MAYFSRADSPDFAIGFEFCELLFYAFDTDSDGFGKGLGFHFHPTIRCFHPTFLILTNDSGNGYHVHNSKILNRKTYQIYFSVQIFTIFAL